MIEHLAHDLLSLYCVTTSGAAMFSDPNMAMDMKNNLSMIVPQVQGSAN